MNIWHDVDAKRITPTDFLAVIEISKGSKMKYELDKTGYAKTENSDFFVSASTGYFVFIDKLMSMLITQRLSSKASEVVVDEERYSAISIKDLGANFYY